LARTLPKLRTSHIVASCYEKELLTFPRINADNREALMDFSILFERSLSVMDELGEFASLNSLETLKEILGKLSTRYRFDWTERAFQIRERTGREAGFREMVEFIGYKAEVMNSMYAKLDWSGKAIGNRSSMMEKDATPHKRRPAVLNTVKGKGQGLSDTADAKPMSQCLYCSKENHRLAMCKEFQKLLYSEKIKWVQENHLCFRCLKKGHWSNKCNEKEGCTKKGCKNPKHHTLLHDEERDQSKEVAQGQSERSDSEKVCSSLQNMNKEETKSSLPLLATVPVRVSCGEREILTYALLDSGSQQTFCTQRLVDELRLEGVDHIMHLCAISQAGGATSVKGKLVSLSVSSLKNNDVALDLSQVMTLDKLPMHTCQVPKWEELSLWEHLKELKDEFLELQDKSVDLLIGTDYPQASIPLETYYSFDRGPVAVKTPLGLTLYGPMVSMNNVCPTKSTVIHVQVTQDPSEEVIRAPHEYVQAGELMYGNSREDRIAWKC